MAGKVYIVGTPIGNLGDMTFRGIETLQKVDFICAEDTRVTLKLLNHFEIKKQLVSCHEHCTRENIEKIVSRVENGESCAVVSDAGMPCISDPGADIVTLATEKGIITEVVPGPTAVASAVAISNISATRFAFEGFLSVTKKQRFEHLKSVAKDTHTLVFYEAPHKLISTLTDMLEYFGDRKISLCRELTKLHEEVIRTTLSGALSYYETVNPRGEFVLVVDGYKKEEAEEKISLCDAAKLALELVNGGEKTSEACKIIAKETGYKKSELYSEVLNLQL